MNSIDNSSVSGPDCLVNGDSVPCSKGLSGGGMFFRSGVASVSAVSPNNNDFMFPLVISLVDRSFDTIASPAKTIVDHS